jgi:hypothetical protein
LVFSNLSLAIHPIYLGYSGEGLTEARLDEAEGDDQVLGDKIDFLVLEGEGWRKRVG